MSGQLLPSAGAGHFIVVWSTCYSDKSVPTESTLDLSTTVTIHVHRPGHCFAPLAVNPILPSAQTCPISREKVIAVHALTVVT